MANTNIVELGPYNITAAKVTALTVLAAGFEGVESAPRTAQSTENTTNAEMVKAFDDLMVTLKWWDDFVVTYEDSNAVFVSNYKNWRKIINTGGRKVKIRGEVTEQVTGAELAGPEIEVVETGEKQKAGKTGKFRFFQLEAGVYTLIIRLAGYADVTINNVVVKAEGITDVDVVMVKLP